MNTRKKGQTIHSEARNIIRRVINKCDEEANSGQLLHPIRQATARAADYCGISERTITRIRRESSVSGEKKLSSPGRKRPRCIEKKLYCSNEDKKVIRSIIHEFYVEKKIVPSGSKLLVAIQEKIIFPWSKHSLYRLLRCMGYKYKRSNNIRTILMEKPQIVHRRVKYLKVLDYYRTQGRNIVYIDEMWVDNNLGFGKCWQSKEMVGIPRNTSSPDRVTMIHAGGKNGFIKGAELIFHSKASIGNYYGHMNADNFENWLTDKLLPNIPPSSVIIMDNAPYHNVQLNKPPSIYSTKKQMMDWLTENKIPYTEIMRKHELLELVEIHKKPEKTFKMNELIKINGHSVLRLPPFMSDLNPMELAWAQIKWKMQKSYIMPDFTDNVLEVLAHEAINEIKINDWEGFCKHVENLEREYWVQDGLLEDAMENLDLDVQSSESEKDSDDSSSDDE